MPNFKVVGQAPGSNDCGFFSGFVLSVKKKYGGVLNTMVMSQQDVYAARDKWLGQKAAGPGKKWLHPSDAGRYLASVGVHGYAVDSVGQITDTARALAYLRNALKQSTAGIMLPYFGGGSGHWVAVLGEQPAKQGKTGSMNFLLYDPDSKLTVHAYAVRDSELTRVMVRNGTFSIVSA